MINAEILWTHVTHVNHSTPPMPIFDPHHAWIPLSTLPRHSYYLADFTRLLLSFSFYLSLFSCKKHFVKHRNITYAINILSLMLHETKERYSISLHIQSECGKIRTRITPNTDFFYAVCISFAIKPCILDLCPW